MKQRHTFACLGVWPLISNFSKYRQISNFCYILLNCRLSTPYAQSSFLVSKYKYIVDIYPLCCLSCEFDANSLKGDKRYQLLISQRSNSEEDRVMVSAGDGVCVNWHMRVRVPALGLGYFVYDRFPCEPSFPACLAIRHYFGSAMVIIFSHISSTSSMCHIIFLESPFYWEIFDQPQLISSVPKWVRRDL